MSVIRCQDASGLVLDDKITRLAAGDRLCFGFENATAYFLRGARHLQRDHCRKLVFRVFGDRKILSANLIADLVAYSHGLNAREVHQDEHRAYFDFF